MVLRVYGLREESLPGAQVGRASPLNGRRHRHAFPPQHRPPPALATTTTNCSSTKLLQRQRESKASTTTSIASARRVSGPPSSPHAASSIMGDPNHCGARSVTSRDSTVSSLTLSLARSLALSPPLTSPLSLPPLFLDPLVSHFIILPLHFSPSSFTFSSFPALIYLPFDAPFF